MLMPAVHWADFHLQVGAFVRNSDPVGHDVVRRSLDLAIHEKGGHDPLHSLQCAHWRQMSLHMGAETSTSGHVKQKAVHCVMLVPPKFYDRHPCSQDHFSGDRDEPRLQSELHRADLKDGFLLSEGCSAPNDAPDLRSGSSTEPSLVG